MEQKWELSRVEKSRHKGKRRPFTNLADFYQAPINVSGAVPTMTLEEFKKWFWGLSRGQRLRLIPFNSFFKFAFYLMHLFLL